MKREHDFAGGRRGAVLKTPPGKSRITIRLDDDVLTWWTLFGELERIAVELHGE